jgi:hypothetical protein
LPSQKSAAAAAAAAADFSPESRSASACFGQTKALELSKIKRTIYICIFKE